MPGEVVAAFDKIQIANFQEINREIAAQGGYQNRQLVIWDRTEGVNLIFTQGVFSKTQLGLMNNARVLTIKEGKQIRIAQRDELETDSEGKITLTHVPIDSWIFVYNRETGEKLTDIGWPDRCPALCSQKPLSAGRNVITPIVVSSLRIQ